MSRSLHMIHQILHIIFTYRSFSYMLGKLSNMSGLDSATKSTIDGPSKEDQEEIDERYRVAEYYCMLSTAIAGGVESPLQFIFQVDKLYDIFDWYDFLIK